METNKRKDVVLSTLKQIVEMAAQNENMKTVAVASADDMHVVESVVQARKLKIAKPILIGNKAIIKECLTALGECPEDYHIEEPKNGVTSGELAVSFIKNKEADFLMKGNMETSALLKPVVNREHGIGAGKVMSHIGIQQIEGYPKLIANTDAAMVPYPDLEKKKEILLNAVDVFHHFGYLAPKVACLCCKEAPDEKMPETMDARKLQEMCENGELGSCHVVGPISYDIAMSKEIAAYKNFKSAYCGDFDILLEPNIHAGNILGKCLEVTCRASMAGIVVGAQVPIVLTSRGASAEEKLNSIALAAVTAK